MAPEGRPPDVVYRIRDAGITIYDGLGEEHELFLEIQQLESILRAALRGLNLDYPLRTRSKVLKGAVCRALGYPVPEQFRKSQPRFPGQDFDTYVQKSNNLQIWNEEISPTRRYVLVRLDQGSIVVAVKVVTGETLARLDPTGTLTQKFQAKSREAIACSVLSSDRDTAHLRERFALAERWNRAAFAAITPIEPPISGMLLPIAILYELLLPLIGQLLTDPGLDQERNRGGGLHRIICGILGYGRYQDKGQFPDLMNQLLEVKLQTSSTVDLGLITPDSTEPIAEVPEARHCDVRYAVFYAAKAERGVRLDHLVLTTGEEFFRFFRRFEGRVLNKKLQIPLPVGFFDEAE
jgi:hypothetical protein